MMATWVSEIVKGVKMRLHANSNKDRYEPATRSARV
jgi:hypothetical protein